VGSDRPVTSPRVEAGAEAEIEAGDEAEVEAGAASLLLATSAILRRLFGCV